ncbi:TOR1B-like protein [Mya arenaria]|uniref:TOR1B-like protein n=1 Tax=Mya arenaria TaxID=6604 RepID=A0ABY7DJS1_MYAAR|nr:TOR1B-like protein [Mya arenaria]
MLLRQDKRFRKGLHHARLAFALNQKLYGQHLAIGPTVKHFREHVEMYPERPLVLSLHGLSGTGKNLVCSLIAEICKQKECQVSMYILLGNEGLYS